MISIHALREEGDRTAATLVCTPANFYPRPPRGGRHIDEINDHIHKLFLSTPSARRATPRSRSSCAAPRYFYPRPPRGGRRCGGKTDRPTEKISIHALREEGDPAPHAAAGCCRYFYPRPPRGGRRHRTRRPAQPRRISIHALREEGDLPYTVRPHRGAEFLSTPSARRATLYLV